MRRAGIFVALILGMLASVVVLWWDQIPLGVPGEWVWQRMAADAQSPINAFLAGLAATAYTGFVIAGGRRLAACRLVERTAWLIGLGMMGFAWLWIVQETAPPAGQLGKAPFVLHYPNSSGYYFKIRYEQPQLGPFLHDYEALMREGDVLHVGTHPPGLFVTMFGLRQLVLHVPGIQAMLRASMPESFRNAANIIRENTAKSPAVCDDSDLAVYWLATLVVLTLATATVWPLYAILRLNLSADLAFVGAALWPTVAALAVFVPKSDAVFPFLSTLLFAWGLWSLRRSSFVGAVVTGCIGWLTLTLSLAFLPVGFCLALIALFSLWDRSEPRSLAELRRWITGGLIGFLTPLAVVWLCGMNLLTIWGWNYHNHAGFYAQYPRTYGLWLLVNPVEQCLSVGWPISLLAGLGAWRSLRTQPRTLIPAVVAACVVSVGLLLWITGKNSGEAARLWLLFDPAFCWIAAQALAAWSSDQPPRRGWWWAGLLAAQLLVSVATVHRVTGFDLGG